MAAQEVSGREVCDDHSSVRHPHLFEISTWPWLERLSAAESRAITLADVPGREWDAIASRGFAFVFLMGVWKRSALGRQLAMEDESLRAEYDRVLPGWTSDAICGSPYCVASYEPDPRVGGWAGVDAARAELHQRGMRLILDFVPNHTAFDHPWTSAYPERYVQGTLEDERRAPADFRRVGEAIVACARDPFFPPWRDVAQLNYFNADTRRAMIAQLGEIGSHCDGVRCDMAMLLLNDVFEGTWRHLLRDRWPVPADEFWPAAIQEYPALTFLAEVYWDREWTLQQQGFHFTYDKRLYDRMQGSSADDVRGHLRADPAFSDRLVRFIENHDERRSAVAFAGRLPAAAVIFATVPGMRFFFDGQLEGRRARAPVQLCRWPDELPNPQLATMYQRLLQVTADSLFHDGEWKLLEVAGSGDNSFSELIAYRWRADQRLAVVVANLGSDPATGHVPIVADLPAGAAFDFADMLSGATYRRTRRALDVRGLFVRLEPGGAHLFVVGREGSVA
jgi:glycosidase